jgi:hypothetical protein
MARLRWSRRANVSLAVATQLMSYSFKHYCRAARPTKIPRISYGSRTDLVRISYGSRTDLVRISYGSHTDLIRISWLTWHLLNTNDIADESALLDTRH